MCPGRLAVSGRVVVVGSVNVDLVVRAVRLPGPGETVSGGTFEQHHGGKGGNQAVAAARLGAPTAFVGAIGADDFGAAARAALAAEGVDVTALATLEGPTGVALIVVDEGGENLIAVASGANHRVTPGLVAAALGAIRPGPGDVLLVCHEIPTPAVDAALRLGREAGACTILNPAPADGLDPAVVALADVLTPNRGELAALAETAGLEAASVGRHPEAVARRLLGAGSTAGARAADVRRRDGRRWGREGRRAIVVTLGAEGALVVPDDGPATQIPAAVVTAVDATGAGDAFNGALAAGLAAGLDLVVAARRAVLAAGLSTTRSGAREGMPTAGELAGPATASIPDRA